MNWRTVLATFFLTLLVFSGLAVAGTPVWTNVGVTFVNGSAANGTTYTANTTYYFNASWANGNDTIYFNIDGTNHTLASAGNGSVGASSASVTTEPKRTLGPSFFRRTFPDRPK